MQQGPHGRPWTPTLWKPDRIGTLEIPTDGSTSFEEVTLSPVLFQNSGERKGQRPHQLGGPRSACRGSGPRLFGTGWPRPSSGSKGFQNPTSRPRRDRGGHAQGPANTRSWRRLSFGTGRASVAHGHRNSCGDNGLLLTAGGWVANALRPTGPVRSELQPPARSRRLLPPT